LYSIGGMAAEGVRRSLFVIPELDLCKGLTREGTTGSLLEEGEGKGEEEEDWRDCRKNK